MDEDTRYRLTTWRKRLERRGWVSLKRHRPPRDRLIEYHVIWQGHLISGRVQLNTSGDDGYWQPGHPTYLLERGQDVYEGVWRLCQKTSVTQGQVYRKAL